MSLTANAIRRVQRDDGAIPHYPGGPIDPWNHVEAAMALDVHGLHGAAEAAYRWLAQRQRPDGGWPAQWNGNEMSDPTTDANFCSYIAVGAWHHYIATDDQDFVMRLWPYVRRTLDLVVALQRPDGTISWALDAAGTPWPGALLTSSSCICISLRCGIDIASLVGEMQPDWELALVDLQDAVAHKPGAFERKDRFSMDWYYPVLSGALDEETARARLRDRWDDFVIAGKGCKCVIERPWVTAGETAELILACDMVGMSAEAEALFDWVQHLRAEDSAYWIGATHPDGTVWPKQKPTWGSGAVVLAADAMGQDSPTSGMFRGSMRFSDPVSDPL